MSFMVGDSYQGPREKDFEDPKGFKIGGLRGPLRGWA